MPASSLSLVSLLSVALLSQPGASGGKPAAGPLMTRWARNVDPQHVLPEYPRPQMVRGQWMNLNGMWDLAIANKDDPPPQSFDKRILVPFAVESALSGVMVRIDHTMRLWYRRRFEVPADWRQHRVLMHFGAVDWEARVMVNGREVGTHRGGYDVFTCDITDVLNASPEQEVVVAVWDPADAGWQPRGKQVQQPEGIWYTPTSGIWQTVWLEPVPDAHVRSVRIDPDVDRSAVTVTVEASLPGTVKIEVLREGKTVSSVSARNAQPVTLNLANPRLWSPDDPFLYGLNVILLTHSTTDSVNGYFGLRKIEVRKDDRGVNRLYLNNEPVFQYGLLDQGFWPDGLYTAPTDGALRSDIDAAKRLGFNMVRKHVKVEPDRWYYWCDTLGLLVWQDMPSGDAYIHGSMPDIQRSPESAGNFERELHALITGLYNHPSIVMWVAYNEGWGQWDTARICSLIQQWDSTRLVNGASGWTDRGVGHVHDVHSYPGPATALLESYRAIVLGEFGGLGLLVGGHTWQQEKNWGYRSFESHGALTDAYVELLRRLRMQIGRGLAAAVYTQISDVEIEVNGLLTYDRAVVKVDEARARDAARKLYLPPPIVTELVPTSKDQPRTWAYSTATPPTGWDLPDFDDSAWPRGPGGFGESGTPGAVVGTRWNSNEIWIRREFELSRVPSGIQLLIHHDEDAEVYLNGVRAATLKDYVTDYIFVPLTPQALDVLKPGRNLIAIHCRQTTGGQYIDAGLVRVIE